jgi:hypothetical protein
LKKQSQFVGGANRHKILLKRGLSKYLCVEAAEKQSQFIRNEYCVLRTTYCEKEKSMNEH